MTERVQIILIVTIAVAVLIVLLVYRNRTKRFKFGASREGINTDLETHNPASIGITPPRPGGVSIKNSVQTGSDHEIIVSRGDVEIEKFKQKGEGQRLNVRSDDPTKK